jgi:hypothetical protein
MRIGPPPRYRTNNYFFLPFLSFLDFFDFFAIVGLPSVRPDRGGSASAPAWVADPQERHRGAVPLQAVRQC